MSRDRSAARPAPSGIAALNRVLYVEDAKAAGKSADDVVRRIAAATDSLPMSLRGKRLVFDEWHEAVRKVYGDAETARAMGRLALDNGRETP